MEVAEKIRRAYRRAGLTQQEAAAACNVAPAQMNAWCTGRRRPNPLTLETILARIAKAGQRRGTKKS